MAGDWDNYTAKTRWRHELESCSKQGLISLIELFVYVESYCLCATDHEALLKRVIEAKKHGRFRDAERRFQRWTQDPDGEFKKDLRRRRSAKAAANRRKKAARLAKKQAQRLSTDPCSPEEN